MRRAFLERERPMILRDGVFGLLGLGLLAGAAAGQLSPGRRPATRPGKSKPAECDDRWLSEVCLDELKRFSATGEYPVLARRIQTAMLRRLQCGHLDDLAALNDMTYVLKACTYLPLAGEVAKNKEFAAWLLGHRGVSRRLFRALGDVPSAEQSLERLFELAGAAEKDVLAHPELAVAFATAEPLKHYRAQPAPASIVHSFQWYTRAKVPFRYDLKKMPYELSRYLADTRLGIVERRWAAAKYAGASDPARAYVDVEIDREMRRKGGAKRIKTAPYTLRNISRLGGDALEQSYYAAEVCKALGMPAAIVFGRSKGGLGHAWIACLKVAPRGQTAYWDCRTGRYPEYQFFLGKLRDPATGGAILDSELTLLGMAAQLPLARREEADAAVLLARLADQARDRADRVDLDVLRKLARLYDQRFAGKDDKPPADTGWIKVERKLDLALVEDLLDAAIARNLVHPPAWRFIISMRKKNRLPVKDLGRFLDVLVTRTAKDYPDYSRVVVMEIVPTIPDPARRERLYRKAIGVYGARADLRGRILIALGDDYRQQDRKPQALRAYEQAALGCVDVAEIVLDASARAENLLIDAGRRDLAVKMYRNLFGRARKRKSQFRQGTAHHEIGRRLAGLLRAAGDEKGARRIEMQL